MKAEKITRIINRHPAHKYPPQTIEQIVQEIESGELSIVEVMSKYEVSRRATVRNWIKTYGKSEYQVLRDLSDFEKRQIIIQIETGVLTFNEAIRKYKLRENTLYLWRKKYPCVSISDNKVDIMETDKTKKNTTDKGLLEELKLKITALETMIDVAEKEFKIEIRKKSGTKQ